MTSRLGTGKLLTFFYSVLGKRQELLDPVRKDGKGILVACEEGGQESLYLVRKHRIGIPCIMCGKGTEALYCMRKDGIETPLRPVLKACPLEQFALWFWSIARAALCPVEPFAQCNFMPCGALCPGTFWLRSIAPVDHCALCCRTF